MTINPIIADLLFYGINVELLYNKIEDKVGFNIGGFYKSGGVALWETEYGFEAHARYNEVTEIRSLQDLIELHLYWFELSKDKYSGWSTIDNNWRGLIGNSLGEDISWLQ